MYPEASSVDSVVSLPMRDGNLGCGGVHWHDSDVVSLPMRDGNAISAGLSSAGSIVVSLPMRDGNRNRPNRWTSG